MTVPTRELNSRTKSDRGEIGVFYICSQNYRDLKHRKLTESDNAKTGDNIFASFSRRN